MMTFLRSRWPGEVPEWLSSLDDLSILRERILQSFLLSTPVLGTVLYGFISPVFPAIDGFDTLIVYWGMLGIVAILALMRRLSYSLRVIIFLLLYYFASAGLLYLTGINGSGPVVLAGFIAICTVFLGAWPGITADFTVLVTIVAMGLAMTQPWLPIPPGTSADFVAPLSEWISRSLVVLVVGGFFVISLSILIEGLRKSLRRQMQFSDEIKREKDTLEMKVAQRTEELERRAIEIETASLISREVSQFDNLDELLARAVELIKKEFRLYYSAIFLLDELKEYAVLQYGSGEAGQTMLAIKHRLKIGETSLVGFAISSREYRLSQDVSLDPNHFKNPLLPDTQSELALPLTVNGECIGVLDAQSNRRNFFTPGDVRALRIAADQLAVAIDKARLVQQLNLTLEDLRASYRQATQQSWHSFFRAARRSYSFSYKNGKFASTQNASLNYLQALKTGEPIMEHLFDQESGKLLTSLAMPIKLHDQVLGILDFHFDSREIPGNSLEVLSAVANRLAMALENARLLEEIQMHAAREHLVGDISAKVRTETEVDQVLKTVAEELGKSLGVTGVLVQLRGDEG